MEMQTVEQTSGNKNDAMAVPCSIIGDEYMTREALAKDLGVSVRTIDRWHILRVGPPRTQLQKVILYRRESVLGWLRSREDGKGRNGRHGTRRGSR